MDHLKTAMGALLTAAMTALAVPAQSASPTTSQAVQIANRGVVQMMISGAAGISVNIAEDLASIVDDGATRRVVPVIGKGSTQNIADLRLLRGIDVAIVQTDVLDDVRERNIYPGIDQTVTFIAKLYNEEFHLLVRRDVKSVT